MFDMARFRLDAFAFAFAYGPSTSDDHFGAGFGGGAHGAKTHPTRAADHDDPLASQRSKYVVVRAATAVVRGCVVRTLGGRWVHEMVSFFDRHHMAT
jgi:hypothetical protein